MLPPADMYQTEHQCLLLQTENQPWIHLLLSPTRQYSPPLPFHTYLKPPSTLHQVADHMLPATKQSYCSHLSPFIFSPRASSNLVILPQLDTVPSASTDMIGLAPESSLWSCLDNPLLIKKICHHLTKYVIHSWSAFMPGKHFKNKKILDGVSEGARITNSHSDPIIASTIVPKPTSFLRFSQSLEPTSIFKPMKACHLLPAYHQPLSPNSAFHFNTSLLLGQRSHINTYPDYLSPSFKQHIISILVAILHQNDIFLYLCDQSTWIIPWHLLERECEWNISGTEVVPIGDQCYTWVSHGLVWRMNIWLAVIQFCLAVRENRAHCPVRTTNCVSTEPVLVSLCLAIES